MKLKAILSAIMFILMIGLAGCVDADHYEPRGYPGFGYYDGGPWWGYGREFHHEGRFDHDRFGAHALAQLRHLEGTDQGFTGIFPAKLALHF